MRDNGLTYDILKEIFNIGVGKAADMLSEIIDRKILLDVPNITIFHAHDSEFQFNMEFPMEDINGTLMVSSISFEEIITGEANLIFPANKMRLFIDLCIRGEHGVDIEFMDFTDMDFDIIREVGNIILNSIIGELGNFLDVNLDYSLPNVKIFNSADFIKDIRDKKNSHILMLHISFIVDDTEIHGAIIINLTFNSLEELRRRIKKVEDDLYE